MQNIKVKRYSSNMPFWEGWVEPEDESWILFIPREGSPDLWLRSSVQDADGVEETHYVPASQKEELE